MRWHTNQWAHTPLGLALCGAVDSPTSACMPFIFLARVFFFCVASPFTRYSVGSLPCDSVVCVCDNRNRVEGDMQLFGYQEKKTKKLFVNYGEIIFTFL